MKQDALADRAYKLRSKIASSMPFGLRCAAVLYRLKIADAAFQDAFGRTLYGVMIARGVDGMPDVKWKGEVKPAIELQGEFKSSLNKSISRLPRGYGKDLGRLGWAVVQKITKNFDMTQEVYFDFMEKVIKKPTMIQGTFNRKQVEGFVTTSLKRLALDKIKSKTKWRELVKDEEEAADELRRLDFSDTKALDNIHRNITPAKIQEALKDIHRKLGPDAAAYIGHLLNDPTLTDRDIANRGLLPEKGKVSPQAVNAWKQKIFPKIKDIFLKHIDLSV